MYTQSEMDKAKSPAMEGNLQTMMNCRPGNPWALHQRRSLQTLHYLNTKCDPDPNPNLNTNSWFRLAGDFALLVRIRAAMARL